MLEILNYIGLFAFSISGVLTAFNRDLDVLGAYVIAFITALGGGTLRDLLLNTDVAWMNSITEIIVVLSSATLGLLFRGKLKKLRRTLALFDTIGIAVFTIVGVQKGLEHNQLYLIAIVLGMMTATFGGMMRDVLCNEIPLIFREELYAIPCMTGGALYLLGCYFGYENSLWLLWGTMLFIATFRILAVRYSWKSPLINKLNKNA